MSENEVGPRAAGWMYAEGDPPGTVRYWTGAAWQGDHQPVGVPPRIEAAAPVRKSKMTRNVFLAIPVVIGLLLAVTLVGNAADRRALDRAGDEFMQALIGGDVDVIEDHLDASCWSDDDVESLLAWSISTEAAGFELDRRVMDSRRGTPVATLGGSVTFVDGGTPEVVPLLVAMTGADGWLVCGVSVGDAANMGVFDE